MENKLYVCGFMFSPDKKQVLLINKLRPDWQNGKINGIGGKVEEGETPIDAIVREFYEETGKTTIISDWSFAFSLSSNTAYSDGHDYKVFYFKSLLGFDDTFSKTDETITIEKVDSLPPNILTGLKWIIPVLLDDFVSTGKDIINNNDKEWMSIFYKKED